MTTSPQHLTPSPRIYEDAAGAQLFLAGDVGGLDGREDFPVHFGERDEAVGLIADGRLEEVARGARVAEGLVARGREHSEEGGERGFGVRHEFEVGLAEAALEHFDELLDAVVAAVPGLT